MNLLFYEQAENFMRSMMTDAAHDVMHIYRVLHTAVYIASGEKNTDMEILITSCLLHDIGRSLQFENPALCHAKEGGRLAYNWLIENGWEESRAAIVRDCITTHRYRSENPPASLEAKILFDADKLDVTGTIGIARTLYYQSHVGSPMYILDENGSVLTGDSTPPSFFREFNFKLRKIYSGFYTAGGKEMALAREKAALDFYNNMLNEVRESHEKGRELLEEVLILNTVKKGDKKLRS